MNNSFVVVGIGEILWDMLPDEKLLGGAPVNFVYHAKQLGADAFPVSMIGKDELGTELLNVLLSKYISTKYIQISGEYPTGRVNVTFNNNEPEYDIVENVAWDFLQSSDDLFKLMSTADAVCFGTLAQRSQNNRIVISSLLEKVNSSAIRYFDLNLRKNYYSKALTDQLLIHANVFKLNADELDVISLLCGLRGNEIDKCISIIEKYNLVLVVLTKGSEGSLLISKDKISHSKPTVSILEDTIGAGDSFSAAVVMGLLNGMELDELNKFANEVAGFVCTQKGGTPELPREVVTRFINNKMRLEL